MNIVNTQQLRFKGLDIYLNRNGRVYMNLSDSRDRSMYEEYLNIKKDEMNQLNDENIKQLVAKYTLKADEIRINGVSIGSSWDVYNASLILSRVPAEGIFRDKLKRELLSCKLLQDINFDTSKQIQDKNGQNVDVKQFFDNNSESIKKAFEKGTYAHNWNNATGTRHITCEYKNQTNYSDDIQL